MVASKGPPLPCPACDHPNAQWLEYISHCNKTEAYECRKCGHVWQVPFDGNAQAVHDRLMHRIRDPQDGGDAEN
jgi:hypothetical protein